MWQDQPRQKTKVEPNEIKPSEKHEVAKPPSVFHEVLLSFGSTEVFAEVYPATQGDYKHIGLSGRTGPKLYDPFIGLNINFAGNIRVNSVIGLKKFGSQLTVTGWGRG